MAFREIFLLHLPAGGASTLRQFGRYMFESLVDESGGADASESELRAQVRALAEDLRLSARALAGLESARGREDWSPEEAALALKAGSWAREILELVRAMEGVAAGAGEGTQ